MYPIVYIMFLSFTFGLKYNTDDTHEEEKSKSIDYSVITN